jgi:hypothetical protein
MPTIKNPEPLTPGTRVRIYWNLHRDVYSVQTHRPGVGWRLAAHVDDFTLTGVSFKVYDRIRRQVLATGVKDVHAYVCGTWAPGEWHGLYEWSGCTYNPMKCDTFVWRDLRTPVDTAAALYGEVREGRPVMAAAKPPLVGALVA